MSLSFNSSGSQLVETAAVVGDTKPLAGLYFRAPPSHFSDFMPQCFTKFEHGFCATQSTLSREHNERERKKKGNHQLVITDKMQSKAKRLASDPPIPASRLGHSVSSRSSS